MRRNRDFGVALLLSSYFQPKGKESLPEVLKRFGSPWPLISLYSHCQRHMRDNLPRWMKSYDLVEKKNWEKALEHTRIATAEKKELIENTLEVINKTSTSTTPHEQSLDDFITKGAEMVKEGKINITATTYIQAIRAKADIEKSNKDRRLDAMKAMFTGAAPKSNDQN
jgi:hypothetical protein